MSEQSLDDILNGKEAPEIESPEPEVAEVVAEEPSRDRDDKGRFVAKGETEQTDEAPAVEESASPAPKVEDPPLEHPALLGERRRRQEAEARAAELERTIAQYRQPQAPAQQEQGPPDQWEDPEGHTQWLISQAAENAKAQAIAEMEERQIRASAQSARGKYSDFEEKAAVFAELANTNPQLGMQLRQSENPGEFAYQTAKTHLEIQQYGSIDKLIEARLAEREKTMLEELQAKLPQSAPPTISGERNVGSRTGPAWSGPTSLSSILS